MVYHLHSIQWVSESLGSPKIVLLNGNNDHKIHKPSDFEVPYFQTQEQLCGVPYPILGCFWTNPCCSESPFQPLTPRIVTGWCLKGYNPVVNGINVNPGLINTVYGCLIGKVPFNDDYWRSSPPINKQWFINPGLTLPTSRGLAIASF